MHKHLLLILMLLLNYSCKDGGSATDAFGVKLAPDVNISLMAVSPANKSLFVGESVQFAASGGQAPYIYTVDSGIGSITGEGFYTAPGVAGSAVVKAEDSKGEEAFATISIAVQISISPTSGTIGEGDTLLLSGSGGIPPYAYRIVAGDGSINASTGLYDATGVSSGSAVIEVRDSSGNTAYSAITINPSLVISPSSQTIGYGEQIAFGTVGGDIPYNYTILTGGGNINAGSGLFVGPSANGSVVVRVTDSSNNTADAVITIVDSPQIDRPREQVATGRSVTFSATNGSPNYTYSIISGGGSIVPATGVFTAPADSDSTIVQVTDINGYTDSTSIETFVAKKLGMGVFHTCLIDFSDITTSTAKCWGMNYTGNYGHFPDNHFYLLDDPSELGDNLPTVNLGTGVQVRGVKVGRYSACAVTTDNRLKCWGRNNYGTLGLGDNSDRGYKAAHMGNNLEWVDLGTGRTINNSIPVEDAISINLSTICVILDNNSTRCWGRGNSGKHGHGNGATYGDGATEVGDNIPVIDFGADYATQISVGYHHSCAVIQDGNVKCWGEGGYGILGAGNETDRAVKPVSQAAIDLGAGRTAQKVSVGIYHSCALLDNGAVKCWGRNNYGQLGQESTASLGDGGGEMGDNLPAIDLGTGKTAIDLEAMYEGNCAIDNSGDVKCWGRNNEGQLGNGSTNTIGDGVGEMGDVLIAVDLGPGRTATKLYGGLYSMCAKLDTGAFKCWGRNSSAQAAQGHRYNIGLSPISLGDNLAPVNISSTESILTMQTNEFSACAVLSNNSLKCWGRDYYGSRGTGDAIVGDEPGDMGANLTSIDHGAHANFKEIKSHIYTVCGLNTDNKLACWGYGGEGSRGSGNQNAYGHVPTHWGDSLDFIDFGTGRTVKDFDVGFRGGCAILDNDAVACWGRNDNGQCGVGNTGDRGDSVTELGDNFVYSDMGSVSTPVQITKGYNHSCARFANGKIKCWGANNYSQLGLGNTTQKGDGGGEMGDNLPFVDFGTGINSTSVCAGGNHTCSLFDNGKVKCWGRANYSASGSTTDHIGNTAGEMGDNLAFLDFGSGRSVTQLTCGLNDTCAILDNETVKCFGRNNFGQLGIGNTQTIGDSPGEMGDNLKAADVGTDRLVLNIELGQEHACAVLDNNTVKCWGRNSEGQLGLGHTTHMGTLDVTMGDSLPVVDTE